MCPGIWPKLMPEGGFGPGTVNVASADEARR
jgi:hypothetical protein